MKKIALITSAISTVMVLGVSSCGKPDTKIETKYITEHVIDKTYNENLKTEVGYLQADLNELKAVNHGYKGEIAVLERRIRCYIRAFNYKKEPDCLGF